jgi:pimeloyl-ACP methyl ester carboxylesterase
MKSLLFIALASYVGLCVLLYVLQDKLIFPAPGKSSMRPLVPAGWIAQPVSFLSHDNLPLAGTLVRPPGEPAPLLIYFGGNAEEILYLTEDAHRYGRFAVLLIPYRGYEGNPGTPSEKAIVADAIRFYDQALATFKEVQTDHIVVHGRSLGSGVAVALAAQRPVRALVLTTPFDSLAATAAYHYPYLPVRWLVRHRFESLAAAPTIKTPALFLVANRDNIVPATRAKALFDAWQAPRQWREFAGFGHNDIQGAQGYWDTIAAFLAAAPVPSSATPPK